jgi:hypothetical protein
MTPTITRLLARGLYHLCEMDRWWHYYLRLREEMILLFGTNEFYSAYNDLAYASAEQYAPSSRRFRAGLFEWEKAAIEHHFPKPPARILIGAAGGGREAFALAEKGYQVTAFEPCFRLVQEMAAKAETCGGQIQVLVGSCQDLWRREERANSESIRIPQLPVAEQLPKFHGIVLGWGSLSHIPARKDREKLLLTCSRMLETEGALLASYLGSFNPKNNSNRPTSIRGRIRHAIRTYGKGESNDHFYSNLGYVHRLDREEIAATASKASLSIVHSCHDPTVYPYCVMKKHLPVEHPA